MELGHLILTVIGIVGSGIALYASYRLLKFKDEFKSEMEATIRANCASKDSFDAHEDSDVQRFESVENVAATRHKEIREDITKVEHRIDVLVAARSK